MILADWVSAQSSLRVLLAADVVKALDRLLADKSFAVPQRSCDAQPLAKSGQWKPEQLPSLAKTAPWRQDLRRLPVTFFAAMASAYGKDTPAAIRLEKLAQRLRPASSIYKKVRQALDSAWQTDSP